MAGVQLLLIVAAAGLLAAFPVVAGGVAHAETGDMPNAMRPDVIAVADTGNHRI